jgi:hypothetical protein
MEAMWQIPRPHGLHGENALSLCGLKKLFRLVGLQSDGFFDQHVLVGCDGEHRVLEMI